MSDQWPTRDRSIAYRDTLQFPRDAALSTLTVLSLRVNEASRGHELDINHQATAPGAWRA
jgi:hypothetical protein